MEAQGWVTVVLLFALLGLHVSDRVVDSDGALGKVLKKHGFPEWILPAIHLCLNHWFRNFKPKVYKMKGKVADGLTGIAMKMQLARLAYAIS